METAELRYAMWQREHNRDAYSWQLTSTRIIFVMVILIVLFGLFLTWLQFTRDLRRRPPRAQAKVSDAETTSVTHPAGVVSSLKISAAGVEVTSQIVGLLILAFSLGFFYLYVKEVYPMRPTLELSAGFTEGKPLLTPPSPTAAGSAVK
jgi:hypothetical protein